MFIHNSQLHAFTCKLIRLRIEIEQQYIVMEWNSNGAKIEWNKQTKKNMKQEQIQRKNVNEF